MALLTLLSSISLALCFDEAFNAKRKLRLLQENLETERRKGMGNQWGRERNKHGFFKASVKVVESSCLTYMNVLFRRIPKGNVMLSKSHEAKKNNHLLKAFPSINASTFILHLL